MHIPPAPGVVAFAPVVSMLNAEFRQQAVKTGTAIEQMIAVATPHIELRKRLTLFGISLSNSVNVVTRATQLLYASEVVAENSTPLLNGMML